MIRRGTTLSLAALLIAAVLALPGLAVADAWGSQAGSDLNLAEQLRDFKQTAFDMRQEADTLRSFGFNKRLSWQTHTARHFTLKEQINRMGRILAQLEEHKSLATDTERMAIEQARPHLVAAADNLTQAMEMVGDDRRNVGHVDYEESVRNLSSHSDALYDKLDAILDFQDAQLRLDGLTG